MANALRSAK
jgi:hypothetical protein